MQKVNSLEVQKLFQEYPFNLYEKIIRSIIQKHNIRNNSYEYDECFDAGMMAYIYSLNRCAFINCNYIDAYIKKVIHIYIKCAIVISNDGKNICIENGFRLIRLNQIENNNKY